MSALAIFRTIAHAIDHAQVQALMPSLAKLL